MNHTLFNNGMCNKTHYEMINAFSMKLFDYLLNFMPNISHEKIIVVYYSKLKYHL